MRGFRDAPQQDGLLQRREKPGNAQSHVEGCGKLARGNATTVSRQWRRLLLRSRSFCTAVMS